MAHPVSAASLAPGSDTYYDLDFTAAGTLEDKIGEFRDEWVSAMIQPSGADLYWRADGVTPTGLDGIVMSDGVAWLFENQPQLLRAMQLLGGTARVHIFG